eukprot:6223956-Prymnesium_polylepis.2
MQLFLPRAKKGPQPTEVLRGVHREQLLRRLPNALSQAIVQGEHRPEVDARELDEHRLNGARVCSNRARPRHALVHQTTHS